VVAASLVGFDQAQMGLLYCRYWDSIARNGYNQGNLKV
jgi:hypothetical protein